MEGLRTSVAGLGTSAERPLFCRKNLESENSRDYRNDPRLWLVFAKTARFPNRTLVRTSFPSASYTIGFASGFALHTLRRIVVLPAFALPMMRIRNLGQAARISSALKAPCLTGSSLDDWASLYAVDMAGEAEECTVSVERDQPWTLS